MRASGETNERLRAETGRRSPLASKTIDRVLVAFVLVLAIAIVALVATPAGVWRRPAIDSVYRGFDANLMFVSLTGPTDHPGSIAVSPNLLTIAASAGSHPTVHLITTPLSYNAAFDISVVSASSYSIPL